MSHPRKLPRLLSIAVLLAIGLVGFAACPEEEVVETPTPTPVETPTPPPVETPTLGVQPEPPQDIAPEVTEPVNGVIETEMGDNFFTKNNLRVRLGETVTIRAINQGQAIHNLRIAGVDGLWNTEDDIVSDPQLVTSGETGVVVFTPQIAGTYTFHCEFHPLEQGGVIVVVE